MTLEELEANFGIAGVLRFAVGAGGLGCAEITAPGGSATLYLQGAHLTAWQPTGEKPVLFVSEKAEFVAGKAIRGGVPIIFPWFAGRSVGERKDGPSHGFARVSEWRVAFAALAGDELHLTLTLAPNEMSRVLGFDEFRAAFQVTVGRTLTMRLTVANDGANDGGKPMVFEEALHTYLAVGDAARVSIEGLEGAEYLDKTDGMKRKVQAEPLIVFKGETDRPYLNTTAKCVLRDPVLERKIVVEKSGSRSTVVWNPGEKFCAGMVDMVPDGWRTMTCIETANVGENAVTLAGGEAHTMTAMICVEALD